MLNERLTEDMVEQWLREHEYYSPGSAISVEKQASAAPRIRKLLENASKRGPGVGKPEFIIRSANHPDFLIVIECKASTQKHISESLTKYDEYAVDGALLYASFLAKEFDVLAVAVSGQGEKHARISHYFHLRGADKPVAATDIRSVVAFDDYYDHFIHSEVKFRQDYNTLLNYSRTINNQLQAKKITEAERGFLVSGILIALKNKAFRQSYQLHNTAKDIALSLVETIDLQFEAENLPRERRDILAQAFSFIPQSPALVNDRDFFVSLIRGIDENINSFMRTHVFYDIIGQFYVEFLRYANNDKGLGIVLTPHHIAELFAELAEVNKNSIVLDNCCGTAGLLIAAMRAMVRDAGADRSVQKRIKEEQIYGIEYQPKVYSLAVSNMVLHGDGKTNIVPGDCFKDLPSALGGIKPTVGLLNPPYRNKTVKDDREELEFVLNNLNALAQDGKCVAIVPITCATAPSGAIADWKRMILEEHTLEAVMSMPTELFHNSKTTVVTCIMVFTAHRPHPKGKKTWFGYWHDDGFKKTKHLGRVDLEGKWPEIRESWVQAFRNREVIPGFSVMREVAAEDEWCAEAYLETDYSVIGPDRLLNRAKQYLMDRMTHMKQGGDSNAD